MTRYRIAIDPRGAAAVVSDRVPGPIVGMDDLRAWTYAPGSAWSADFGAVLREARRHNRPMLRDPMGEGGE